MGRTKTASSDEHKRPSFAQCMDKLSLDILEAHFHLPLRDVAEKFNVCVTFFKKVCRAHGIERWPHRKVAQIQKLHEKLGEAPQQMTVKSLEEMKQKAADPSVQDRTRVAVWDVVKKRKLSGMAAPLQRNLALYLREHPDCEVYEGQDRSAKYKGGNRPAKRPRLSFESTASALPASAFGPSTSRSSSASDSTMPSTSSSAESSATVMTEASALDWDRDDCLRIDPINHEMKAEDLHLAPMIKNEKPAEMAESPPLQSLLLDPDASVDLDFLTLEKLNENEFARFIDAVDLADEFPVFKSELESPESSPHVTALLLGDGPIDANLSLGDILQEAQ